MMKFATQVDGLKDMALGSSNLCHHWWLFLLKSLHL